MEARAHLEAIINGLGLRWIVSAPLKLNSVALFILETSVIGYSGYLPRVASE